jgi:hypothetical protein
LMLRIRLEERSATLLEPSLLVSRHKSFR